MKQESDPWMILPYHDQPSTIVGRLITAVGGNPSDFMWSAASCRASEMDGASATLLVRIRSSDVRHTLAAEIDNVSRSSVLPDDGVSMNPGSPLEIKVFGAADTRESAVRALSQTLKQVEQNVARNGVRAVFKRE